MGKAKNAAKAIGNIFWKNDEEDSSDTDETPVVNEKSTASLSSSTPLVSTIPLEKGKEDSKIKVTLIGALAKTNKPGYDYFEFAQAVEDQAKIIPTEETRFQATFAAAKSMGISQSSLVADANYYIDVLKQEEKKFSDSMEGLTKQNISLKEAELADIDKQTENMSAQIKQLTENIGQMQQKKNQLTGDIASNKTKIDQLKSNFSATLKVMTDKISGDIEKIKKYIPA